MKSSSTSRSRRNIEPSWRSPPATSMRLLLPDGSSNTRSLSQRENERNRERVSNSRGEKWDRTPFHGSVLSGERGAWWQTVPLYAVTLSAETLQYLEHGVGYPDIVLFRDIGRSSVLPRSSIRPIAPELELM